MTSPVMFVSMPFGYKRGRLNEQDIEIDFDSIWKELIRPAAPDGWSAVRIDEVNEPGSVPTQYINYLRTADVVVFDLTFGNLNVYYELGMRHALIPNRSVLIAQQYSPLPFNIQHQRVLFYDFFNKDSWDEFRSRLQAMVLSCGPRPDSVKVVDQNNVDEKSPRQSSLLDKERLRSQLSRAKNLPQLISIWGQWKAWDLIPVDSLLELGERLDNERRIDLAVEVLARAYQVAPDEFEVARTYGWYLRKNGQMKEAEDKLLKALDLNGNDIESMGMLGGLYKRQKGYAQSYQQYKRAIEIDSNNVYHLVNLGALEVLLHPDQPESSRDWYSKVIDLCEKASKHGELVIWDVLALAESYLAIGEIELARREYSQAVARGATVPMLQSAADQLNILKEAGFQVEGCSSILRDVLDTVLYPPSVGPATIGGDADTDIVERSERCLPVIIHLSDIHFGYKTDRSTNAKNWMHRFKHDTYNRPLAEYITSEIKRLQDGNANRSIVLVVSGDTAYEATSDEYEEAQKFVEKIRGETGLVAEHIVFVPGNHDVNWALAKHKQAQRFDEYLYFLQNIYGEDSFYSLYPHIKWDFRGNTTRPDPSDILAIHKLTDLNLVILGFNSCIFENEQHHYGLIGEKQLNRAKQFIDTTDPQMIKVAVLHHHIIPVENRIQMRADEVAFDISIVRDFGLVEDHLHRIGIDIVLHGHKHMPALRELLLHSCSTEIQSSKRLIVCGAGSTGVCEAELPHQTGNHMEVLKFQNHLRVAGDLFVKVEWRELEYTDVAQWETTREWAIWG